MKRWTNDYKIVERVRNGWEPCLPLQSKLVGEGVYAILMEMGDVEYQCREDVKQILNDLGSPDRDKEFSSPKDLLGGKALHRYVAQRQSELALCELLKLFFKKLFRAGH